MSIPDFCSIFSYLPDCKFDNLPSEVEASIKAFLAQQNKVLVQNGDSYEICSPSMKDCVPASEWAKVGLAIYDRLFGVRAFINKKSFVQAHHNACWAATLVTVYNIQKNTNYTNELSYFTKVMQNNFPSFQTIRSYFLYIRNNINALQDYTEDEKNIISTLPVTDSIQAWTDYFARIPISCLTSFYTALAKNPTTNQVSETKLYQSLARILAYLRLAYASTLEAKGETTAWPRSRKHERSLYEVNGFQYEEIPINDFTETRLRDLLSNGPIITALNHDAMYYKGADLTKYLQQIETISQSGPLIDSHYIVVLSFDFDTKTVVIINTLYVVGTSPTNYRVYSAKDKKSGAEPSIVRMQFDDFRRALVSDVACNSNTILQDGTPELSPTEASRIPVASLQ